MVGVAAICVTHTVQCVQCAKSDIPQVGDHVNSINALCQNISNMSQIDMSFLKNAVIHNGVCDCILISCC